MVLRIALGPFQIGTVAVHSPLPIETMFWIGILGLLLTRRATQHSETATSFTNSRLPKRKLLFLLGAVALAYFRNLSDPFLSDDYILVNRALTTGSFNLSALLSSFHTAGGDGGFRPLGWLYYQLVAAAVGAEPTGWHLFGLMMHLANTALVFTLAWRMWRDATAATVSALWFGLHGTRPEVVVWTAGNFDLLACACVLVSVNLAFAESSRSGRRYYALPVLLVIAGVLCKESAYAAPFVVFGIIIAAPGAHKLWRFLSATAAVCAVLFAYRWYLFGGPGGYVNPATGQPQIAEVHLLLSAKAIFLRIWAILLIPNNWDSPLNWWTGIAILAVMAASPALIMLARRDSGLDLKIQMGLIAATCAAVLPAIHLALIGQSVLGSRILYLPGVTFALLIGSWTRGHGILRNALATVILVGTAGILEHNLQAWHSVALLARETCRAAATDPDRSIRRKLPETIQGVFFFRNGFDECVSFTSLHHS